MLPRGLLLLLLLLAWPFAAARFRLTSNFEDHPPEQLHPEDVKELPKPDARQFWIFNDTLIDPDLLNVQALIVKDEDLVGACGPKNTDKRYS